MTDTYLLTTTTLIKELKAEIIGQARALFRPKIAAGEIRPAGRVIDVIVLKNFGVRDHEDDSNYGARIISYIRKDQEESEEDDDDKEEDEFAKWIVLARTDRGHESPIEALLDLLDEMYRQAGKVVWNLEYTEYEKSDPEKNLWRVLRKLAVPRRRSTEEVYDGTWREH